MVICIFTISISASRSNLQEFLTNVYFNVISAPVPDPVGGDSSYLASCELPMSIPAAVTAVIPRSPEFIPGRSLVTMGYIRYPMANE